MSTLASAASPKDEWLPHSNDCPSWCEGGHATALAEGCGWSDSQQHSASVSGGVLHEITYADRACRPFGASWEMHVEERPLSARGGSWGPPFVHLRVSDAECTGVTLPMTSGEARVLARQLVAAADLLDL